MKLHIQHFTRYQYSQKVVLNPHLMFLTPQQRSYFDTEKSTISIVPEPTAVHERVDMLGNAHACAWFEGATEHLSVELAHTIQLRPFNPFGFLLTELVAFPFTFFVYDPEKSFFLQPFLQTEQDPKLAQYVIRAMDGTPDLVSFLSDLTGHLHDQWEHIIREEQDLWSPDHTFQQRRGSCRDLSWMLVHMLRNVGLAARFVSGYAFNPELAEGHELHAWAEVYLPGAGWIGLDPSLGLLADNQYIPLATGHHPKWIAPVQGSFYGKASAALETEVWIEPA